MTVITKPIPECDINEVVQVHNNAFKGFFLTELGPEFLSKYYRSVARSEDGLLLGAYSDNKLLGFCAGCLRSSGFNSKLIKTNFYEFGLIGIKLLFTRPLSLLRLIKNLSKTGTTSDKGDYAELLSIAVDQNAQNLGIGKLLMEELERYLKDRGINDLSLTTDKFNNQRTIQFYKKQGFNELYIFTTYPNREMYRLIKTL